MKGGRSGMSRAYVTPCFVMERKRLDKNLEKISLLEEKSGVKILHTLKSFNETSVLPLISAKLSGMSSASVNEVKMAHNADAKHVHLYAPAFKEDELKILTDEVDTISFNSLSQWKYFSSLKIKASKGLRINPKLNFPIPDYCNPNVLYSRLGVDGVEFRESYNRNPKDFLTLEGLHFHALYQSCVQGLIILFEHIETHFQWLLPKLKWLNLGGGHNFSDDHYDVEAFVKMIKDFNRRYPHIQLYFEPGESVLKNSGDFVTTVLDIVDVSGKKVVILDTSVETHLLDVAIVNLRQKVKGTQADSTPYFYELAGNSCLQGDHIGEYFFLDELKIGDLVVFEDMMGYTMVKMTEFNGMNRASFLLV